MYNLQELVSVEIVYLPKLVSYDLRQIISSKAMIELLCFFHTCSWGNSDKTLEDFSSTIKIASSSCMSAQLNWLPTRKSCP